MYDARAHWADQRFYASIYGRFNTPDPSRSSAGPSDPGSWNRYSYVEGDPVNNLDPTGMDLCDASAWLGGGQIGSALGCLCPNTYQASIDPYNSLCGGGSGPGYWSMAAIGAAIQQAIQQAMQQVEQMVPPPVCGSVVGIPSSQYETDELALLFGEDSWTLGYPKSQVAQEDLWMLNGMANQALAYNQKPNQAGVEVSIQRGAYLGYASGSVRLDSALSSAAGSSTCQHLQEAENTFESFWSAGGIFAQGYSRWVSNNARTQPAPTDVTIAGTTFFLGASPRIPRPR